MTRNTDIDKYQYSGYEIGFDKKSSLSFPGGGFGQNVIIFEVAMSSSAHVDNKKKNIFILGKVPTKGLEHTLTAEKMYSINSTMTKKNFVQVCITMEQIVSCLLMVPKFTNC